MNILFPQISFTPGSAIMKIIKVGEINTLALYVICECKDFESELASCELNFWQNDLIPSRMSVRLS